MLDRTSAPSDMPPLGGPAHPAESEALGSAPERSSLASALGTNAVGALTALAFVAFLFAYAIFGQRAAGIAFWGVMFGLPATLVLISAVGAVWGGRAASRCWKSRRSRSRLR